MPAIKKPQWITVLQQQAPGLGVQQLRVGVTGLSRAGKTTFWVTWDGYMTPCGMMPEPKVDLMAQSFAAAWQKITELAGALCLSGVCDTCPNIKTCHPCAAIAYAETGKASGIPTYMCRAAQEMRRIACETLHEEINNA